MIFPSAVTSIAAPVLSPVNCSRFALMFLGNFVFCVTGKQDVKGNQ